METEKVRSLIKTTAVYAVVIGGLVYLQYYQRIMIPVPFEDATIGRATTYVDPTFLFLPLLSLLTCNYASKVIKAVIVGKLGTPLSSGANRIGLSSFVWLLTLDPSFPPYLQPLGDFILLVAVVSVARSLASTILIDRNQVVGETVIKSAAILLMGILTSRVLQQVNTLLEEYGVFSLSALAGRTPVDVLLGLFYGGLLGVLERSILLSAFIVAGFSLTGILRHHPNPYLDYVGRRLSSRLDGKFMLAFSLLVYVFFLREFALVHWGIEPQLVILAEWCVICIASYITYRKTRKFVSESMTATQKAGYWTRHIQEIEHRSDFKLDNLAGLVKVFMGSGDRDDLIVYMVDVFRRFNVPVSRIGGSVSELINHREIEMGLTTFSWQRRFLERMNLERRREALGAVMDKLQQLSIQMSYSIQSTPDPFMSKIKNNRRLLKNEN